MRNSLVLGLLSLFALSACVGGAGSDVSGDDDHVQVCEEQSAMAQSGLIPSGEIAISCPDHGIGLYGADAGYVPASAAAGANEYNRNADIYRAGFAGAIATATAR